MEMGRIFIGLYKNNGQINICVSPKVGKRIYYFIEKMLSEGFYHSTTIYAWGKVARGYEIHITLTC